MENANTISENIARLRTVNAKVEKSFSSLSLSQLSWKSSEDSWSIAECLQHIITSNEKYFPALGKLSKAYTPSFWEKWSPMSRSIGKNMIKTLGLTVKSKFKSPKLFLPAKILFPENIIETFSKHQDLLISKFDLMKIHEGRNVIITSPVSALITLPLSECLEVLTGHEERHLNQAINVMLHHNFPNS